MAKKNGSKTTPVDSHRHKDKRTNIPTEELRDFVKEEEQAPEDIRAQARKRKPEEQLNLFSDFNGIAFEDLIDFYHHESNWANRMVPGDSLLVMTSLAEKEGLKGQVQYIYIDPFYGIKFGSNWQVSTRKRDVKDGEAAASFCSSWGSPRDRCRNWRL